jgi:uncharacterized protein
VLLNLVTRDPVGNRKYWPRYGWVPSYFEDHANYSMTFSDQVIILVAEGVFARFPALRIVLQEGGFTWLPALLWRWAGLTGLLKDDLPQLELLPSKYCRRHLWFTTQPIEEPERPRTSWGCCAGCGWTTATSLRPTTAHWDFDSPDQTIPAWVSPELRAKIFWPNALDLYDCLPHTPSSPE